MSRNKNLTNCKNGLVNEVDVYRELFYFVCSDLMNVVFENFDDKRFIDDLQKRISDSVTPIIVNKIVALDIMGYEENSPR